MTSKVTYKSGLSTEAIHLRSGQSIVTDAPVDNKGRGQAFSPTDLMATSLASCMLTIMGIAAESHGIDMDGSTAEVTKIMSKEGPRKVDEIKIDVHMPARDYSKKELAILKKAAESCPVGRSLHPDLKQTIKLHWNGPGTV